MRRTLTLLAALALSACAQAPLPPATATVEARASTSGGGASTAVAVTNANRRAMGLPNLRVNRALTRAAQAHAEDMQRMGRMTHYGSNGSQLQDRIRAAGFRACLAAENIAMGPWDGNGVAAAWLRSPGHRRNALHPRGTLVGAGRAGQAWVMVIARPC